MFQPENGPINGKPVWVTTDLSEEGDEAIKNEIKSNMKGCKIALFLIGQDVHNSPWINYELSYATSSLRIPCFGIQHPLMIFGPPNSQKNIKLIDWNPKKIASILNAIQ